MKITRREFATRLALVGGAGIFSASSRLSSYFPEHPEKFLLSTSGCGRATGYSKSNKVVTIGDKTHMAWLDSDGNGFWVRARTLNNESGAWSDIYTIGKAVDNHGGPALAVDSRGYLHVAYGPHSNQPMCYRRSSRPNDVSQWEAEEQIGRLCTYPTLVVGPDDTLYLTFRSEVTSLGRTELWRKPPRSSWRGPTPLLQSRYDGYTSFLESLAWDSQHASLHLACMAHEKSDAEAYGRIQTLGYMTSRDFGETWTNSLGERIALPATAETFEVLAAGGMDRGSAIRIGMVSLDGLGRPHVSYTKQTREVGELFITRLESPGNWRTLNLTPYLPAELKGWRFCDPGGVSFVGQEGVCVVGTIQNVRPEELDPINLEAWGHPSNEVIQFNGELAKEDFSVRPVSLPNPKVCQWLPNVERSTGFNRVPAQASVLFTSGPPGATNGETLKNMVIWTTT